MGLDVSAFEHVELVRAVSHRDVDWDEYESHDDWTVLSNMPAFIERGDGMAEGIYKVSGRVERWAAGYTSYGLFRKALCEATIGVAPERVWKNYDRYAARPFAPLINFADNEGFLGPVTCTRLAEDADDFPDLDLGEWTPHWGRWVAMFNLAADDGVIRFHGAPHP